MIELFFVACLVSSPDQCKENTMQIWEQTSLLGCMMGAQPQIARWNERNPRWRVARWNCRPAGAGREDI